MTTTHDPLAAWEAGDLMDGEGLRAMADEYRALDATLAPLEERRKALRGALERITTRLGGKAQAGGYDLSITAGGESVSFDRAACEQLLARLVENGLYGPAEELAAARKVTPRATSLRVARSKELSR